MSDEINTVVGYCSEYEEEITDEIKSYQDVLGTTDTTQVMKKIKLEQEEESVCYNILPHEEPEESNAQTSNYMYRIKKKKKTPVPKSSTERNSKCQDQKNSFEPFYDSYTDVINSVAEDAFDDSKTVVFTDNCQQINQNNNIPFLMCIVKYKGLNDRVEKISVDDSESSRGYMATPLIEIKVTGQTKILSSFAGETGEFIVGECLNAHGQIIAIAAVSIYPNRKIDDIICFMRRCLLAYSQTGAALLGTEEDKFPLILIGNSNLNFALRNSDSLKKILQDEFNLTMSNSAVPRVRSGTIDTLFTRYLHNVEPRLFISYMSDHEPTSPLIPMELLIEEPVKIEIEN